MDTSAPRPAANVVLRPGDIIVADVNAAGGGGAVLRIDPVSGEQTVVSSGGLFENPNDVVVDRDGTLLVVDTSPFGVDRLIRVQPATGAQTVVSAGENLSRPWALAIELAGTVLISDVDRLIRVDPLTGAQTVVPVAAPAFVEDMVLDRSGDVLATFPTRGGGRVFRINPATGANTAVASGFVTPEGLALEADGHLIVVDPSFLDGSPAVVRVDLATGDKAVLAGPVGFAHPGGVTVEADGHILVADGGAGSILRVDPTTGATSVVSQAGLFRVPSGMAVVGPAPATIVGRHVFYNRSSFDGNSPAAEAADDNAIATDKTALVPGQTATFSNITSYIRGINGVMIDIENLPDGAPLTADDFAFQVDRQPDPAADAPPLAPSSVVVRRGAGAGGSDRVSLVWTDGVIRNAWLQVTVKANANTGLSSVDTFSFGNLVGETGNRGQSVVNSLDVLAIRRNFFSHSSITGTHDFDRNGIINATDLSIARSNYLHRLSPVAPSSALQGASRFSRRLASAPLAEDVL